jgi:hypothetical protein
MTPLPTAALRRLGLPIEHALGQVPQDALDKGCQRLSRRLAPEGHAKLLVCPRSRQM